MAGDERGHEHEGAREAYEPPRVEDVPTEDAPVATAAGGAGDAQLTPVVGPEWRPQADEPSQ